MKVKELIDELARMDSELDVIAEGTEWNLPVVQAVIRENFREQDPSGKPVGAARTVAFLCIVG